MCRILFCMFIEYWRIDLGGCWSSFLSKRCCVSLLVSQLKVFSFLNSSKKFYPGEQFLYFNLFLILMLFIYKRLSVICIFLKSTLKFNRSIVFRRLHEIRVKKIFLCQRSFSAFFSRRLIQERHDLIYAKFLLGVFHRERWLGRMWD